MDDDVLGVFSQAWELTHRDLDRAEPEAEESLFLGIRELRRHMEVPRG